MTSRNAERLILLHRLFTYSCKTKQSLLRSVYFKGGRAARRRKGRTTEHARWITFRLQHDTVSSLRGQSVLLRHLASRGIMRKVFVFLPFFPPKGTANYSLKEARILSCTTSLLNTLPVKWSCLFSLRAKSRGLEEHTTSPKLFGLPEVSDKDLADPEEVSLENLFVEDFPHSLPLSLL